MLTKMTRTSGLNRTSPMKMHQGSYLNKVPAVLKNKERMRLKLPAQPMVFRHQGAVDRTDREHLLGQRAMTLWLTGLSAAGKSTLAYALELALIKAGKACYVLDGDNVRHGLNRDLDFSSEARSENIRRVAEVARLLNDAGLIVITAFISPFTADRELARTIVGNSLFKEVFVSTPLEVCESRDPKGLYRQARWGRLDHFTGISSPYELPEAPDLIIDTGLTPIDEAVERLVNLIESDQ